MRRSLPCSVSESPLFNDTSSGASQSSGRSWEESAMNDDKSRLRESLGRLLNADQPVEIGEVKRRAQTSFRSRPASAGATIMRAGPVLRSVLVVSLVALVVLGITLSRLSSHPSYRSLRPAASTSVPSSSTSAPSVTGSTGQPAPPLCSPQTLSDSGQVLDMGTHAFRVAIVLTNASTS